MAITRYEIVGFNPQETNAGEVFTMMEEIYSSSDGMSERFEEKFASAASVLEYFKQIATQPGGIVIFANVNRDLAGYVTVKPRFQSKLRHTADLNMGLKSGYRGMSIGTGLLKAAIEKISADKIIEIVYLMVRTDNQPAIKLYEKFGFEELAILERDTKISNKYYDGMLMRKFFNQYI
jgi:ribosomal protein S18 acetylase RimI-like enzyme